MFMFNILRECLITDMDSNLDTKVHLLKHLCCSINLCHVKPFDSVNPKHGLDLPNFHFLTAPALQLTRYRQPTGFHISYIPNIG